MSEKDVCAHACSCSVCLHMLYLCNWNLHSVKLKGDFLFTHVACNRWLFKATTGLLKVIPPTCRGPQSLPRMPSQRLPSC